MSRIKPPAPRPCETCPYRRDVPSGVWSAEEYEKLPGYDRPTYEQPFGAFQCHQQDGRLCAGWVGCHDMDESLGLRMAVSAGLLSETDYEATLDYITEVPLFGTGAEAARHGLADLDYPSEDAVRAAHKVARRQAR